MCFKCQSDREHKCTDATGVATSPYGTLPAAPLVAQPQVEHKVGITQRPKAGVGSALRPVAVVTPRSIAPRSGVRLRNPRLRFASRCAPSLTCLTMQISTWARACLCVMTVTVCRTSRSAEAAADLNSNGGNRAVNGGGTMQMRENPRRLFVRDPLPATEPASQSQPSPPEQQDDAQVITEGSIGGNGDHGKERVQNRLHDGGGAQARHERRAERRLSDAEVGVAAVGCSLRAHMPGMRLRKRIDDASLNLIALSMLTVVHRGCRSVSCSQSWRPPRSSASSPHSPSLRAWPERTRSHCRR